MAVGLSIVGEKIDALRVLIAMCLSLFIHHAIAVENPYPFDDAGEEKRYQQLLLELRCMVCENQALSDSNAPLAQDLRQEVYRQMQEGRSDADIKEFLVARYGVAILYDPPVQKNTWILWGIPGLLLLIGMGVWYWQVNRKP